MSAVREGPEMKFTARGRLQRTGDIHNLGIVKIQSSDRVSRLRHPRLLFQADRLPMGIEFNHAIALRIMDGVCEDAGAFFTFGGVLNAFSEIVPVKDVVAENQRAAMSVDKILRDQKCLRDAFWLGLCGIGQS